MDVTYRNDTLLEIAEVRVAMVVHNIPVWVFNDTAKISPGVKIRRLVEIPYQFFPLADEPTCPIAQVRYADGATWTNPFVDITTNLEQTPDSRIAIRQCEPTRSGLDTHTNIRLVNEAPSTAKHVVLSLWEGENLLERYDEPGPFAPGVPVVWHPYADQVIFPLTALRYQCRVDQVEYADGSTWTNPAMRDPYWTPQTAGSQIDVLQCSTAWYDPRFPSYHSIVHVDHGVGVAYRNTAAVPATLIDFEIVEFGKSLARARMTGSFAPGVQINRELGLPVGVGIGTALPACVVRRVEYADGTSWANPVASAR